MAQKNNPHLRPAGSDEPVNSERLAKLKLAARKHKRGTMRKWFIIGLLAVMIVGGTYLLMKNQSYKSVRTAETYTEKTSDTNRYAQFKNKIVRYSRDGIVLLNRKNEEQWIQPCQIKNPIIDVNEDTFAVADSGGNTIMVFTEKGLKGEMETTLPIEKISVSNQGIVSAILKNENSPLIVTYDATGNILVEHHITLGTTGYPMALDMSPDGLTLAVSYLFAKDGVLKSRVAYYNFGEAGRTKTDNQVSIEQYAGAIIPEVFFMDENTSVAVSDSSFIIYQGKDKPRKTKEIKINQEIKSVFHTEQYIGFVLLNQNKSGYEVRLYNKAGREIMDKALAGEYSNVKMVKDQIIMYEGSKCCIITKNGVTRFKGDLGANVLEVMPTWGINRYLVMSANELRVVYLTK